MRPFIDDRGRFFGILNLIDAFVGVFVLLLVPLGYGAMKLFHQPPVVLTAISPMLFHDKDPIDFSLIGNGFRPFMKIRVGEWTGDVALMTPSHAGARIPELPAGTYDVILLDEGHPLATLHGALVVQPPPPPPRSFSTDFVGPLSNLLPRPYLFPIAPPPVNAMVTARVRFVVRRDVQLTPGEVDDDDIVLNSVDNGAREPVVAHVSVETSGHGYGIDEPLDYVWATVQLDVTQKHHRWYHGDILIADGILLTFNGSHGPIQGWIESLTAVPVHDLNSE